MEVVLYGGGVMGVVLHGVMITFANKKTMFDTLCEDTIH